MFTGKAMYFLVSLKKCILAMFSCFKKSEKKNIYYARFINFNPMSHVELIGETRVCVCDNNMKSLGFFCIFTVFRKFFRKNI